MREISLTQGQVATQSLRAVSNHLDLIERSFELLKETVDRNVYSETIDNALQSLELRLFMFRTDLTKLKEENKVSGTTNQKETSSGRN